MESAWEDFSCANAESMATAPACMAIERSGPVLTGEVSRDPAEALISTARLYYGRLMPTRVLDTGTQCRQWAAKEFGLGNVRWQNWQRFMMSSFLNCSIRMVSDLSTSSYASSS